MSPTRIHIPTPLRAYAEQQSVLEVEAATVGDALRELVSRHPQLQRHLYDDEGRLRRFVNVYRNQDDVRHLDGERTAIAPGDTLSIVPSIAGGAPEPAGAAPPRRGPPAWATGEDGLPPMTQPELLRYGRHLILPEVGLAGQRRLKASSVLLVGAGGLGSPLALYLAAAGIGRIGLVDFDVVDESNLQRQLLHGTGSVGRSKLESARERLADVNPNVRVETYETHLDSENALDILRPYDVVADGTDNFPTRYLVNDACVLLGKPLVFASGAFIVYDLVTFQQNLKKRLETDADILVANSVTSVVFKDPKETAKNLQALTAEPHVLSAAVYDADGRIYASWSRDPSRKPPPRLGQKPEIVKGGLLQITRPVDWDGARVGTLVIDADLGERVERFRRYLLIVLAVCVVSFLLAILIAARQQRTISQPILTLAEAARIVSRDKDYSVRVQGGGQDEIGQLIGTFNEMLSGIQRRDRDLQEARGSLESRIQERTGELQTELAERRRAEEALRHSQLLLAESQRLAHIGSWEWDATADVVRWSEELYRVYGLDPVSFRATFEGFLERVHPDDRDFVRDVVTRGATQREAFSFDHRILRPDGTARLLHAEGRVEFDDEERFVRMFGTAQDITERRRSDEAREELIRAQTAQAAAERVGGIAALQAEISAELASSFDVETTIPRVVRLPVPEFADWCSVRLVDGDRVRLVAAADSDPAHEKLAWEIDSRYPMSVEEDSPIVRAMRENRSQVMVNIHEGDLRGLAKSPEHLSLMKEMAVRSAMIVPLRARGPSNIGVFVLGSRSDKPVYQNLELPLAEDIAGRIATAIDNARLYREAQEANRIKDEFLATLSHELRTPLNAIVGWSSVLRTGGVDADTVRRAIETIDRNARAQAQLIDDILDVSRIVAGKLRLLMQPVDLGGVVDAAMDSVEPAAEAKEILLRKAVDPTAGLVSGDPARLQQIVWNLLSNAIKFTPRGGRVMLTLSRLESSVEVRVQDSGIGIDPEFLPHVFDRFRQADSSSTRSHGGLGLGLAIVRHLVELHGGRVEAESGGVNQGASFRAVFPMRAVQPAAPQLGIRAPSSVSEQEKMETLQRRLDGVQVLVVDDEPDSRVLVSTILERMGATVRCYGSVADALRALEAQPPDLLISDIEMPGADGYDLIRKVRSLPPERGGLMPAAALTAYARSEDRLKALLAGFNIHIAKPVEPAELAAVAVSLMNRTPVSPAADTDVDA